MLSKQAVTEFQAIYKKEFGEDISIEKADELGTKMLRLFKLIYKPIPLVKNEHDGSDHFSF